MVLADNKTDEGAVLGQLLADTREFKNQKTGAVVKAAVLNQFIQIAAPKAVKVA